MKKTSQILITIVLLFFSSNSFSQDEVYITLNVDTSRISHEGSYQYCTFDGQEPDTDSRQFTSHANIGDDIVWRGVSSSSPENDVVTITSIGYEGGTNVFSIDELPSDGGRVSRKIKYDTSGKADYKYIIYFNVLKKGESRPQGYQVDPKIKVGGN